MERRVSLGLLEGYTIGTSETVGRGQDEESLGRKENRGVKRTEKTRIVEELRAKFVPCDVAVLTRFSGLKVSEINRLRNDLRRISVDYRVVKNTLVKQAMEGTDIALLGDHLQGPIAIAIARGEIGPIAKMLTGYIKDHPKLSIHAGLAQGRVLTGKDVEQAATLPGREEMLARLMYMLNAPLVRMLNALNGVPANVVRTLGAIQREKEKQG
jgi:large subunit ribosomal protein L10